MSLTPMVNVDPFDLTKYHPEINQDVPFDLSKPHDDHPPSREEITSSEASVPVFTIHVLPEYDQENERKAVPPSSSSSSSSGHKHHPLAENRSSNIISPPPEPENKDVVTKRDSVTDSVTKLSRKKLFRDEKLVLECEWDDCDESFRCDGFPYLYLHTTTGNMNL